MSTFYKILFLAQFAGLFLNITLNAESEDEVIKIKFRAFSWGGNVSDIFYTPLEGKEKSISLYMSALTDEFEYKGQPKLVFYKKSKDKQNEITRLPMTSVNIPPEQGNNFLIIFIKTPGKTDQYRALIYANNGRVFPRGSLRMYNFTQKQIVVKLGDTVKKVEFGQTEVFEHPKEQENANVEISKLIDPNTNQSSDDIVEQMMVAVNGDSGWVPAFRSAWPRKKRARSHFFIFPVTDNSYRVHTILEYPPSKKKTDQKE